MAGKGNTFKKQSPEEEDKKLRNEPKTSKERKSDSGGNFLNSTVAFFRDERLHKITGLFMLLMAVYSLIAFTSFIFTWEEDQDKVLGSWFSILSDPDLRVENWLGKFGAILSHQFIYEWFGVSSFLFSVILLVTGIRVVFEVTLYPLKKLYQYSFFMLIWSSTTLGYLVDAPNYLFLGGGFGIQTNKWLNSILGSAGTGFLLFFLALTFGVIVYNISFKINPKLSPVNAKDEEDDSEEEVIRNPVTGFNQYRGEEPATTTEDEEEFIEGEIPEPVLMVKANPLPEERQVEKVTFVQAEEQQVKEKEPVETVSALSQNMDLSAVVGPTVTDEDEEIEEEEFQEEEFELEGQITENNLITAGDVTVQIEEIPDQEVSEENLEDVMPSGEYDPKLDLSSYQFPTMDLLENHGNNKVTVNKEELEANSARIVETLGHYNIEIEKIKATIGPTVTLYEIIPKAGIRISKIKNLEDDIALSLAALGIRIIAPIPGKGTIGIEVPNQKPEVVSMKSILMSEKFQNTEMDLPIALGKTISNEVFIADLAKMPHLLMAGATGQGKSVGLNAILVSLLYKKHPSQVKFVLVDPKKVELTLFKRIERHFLAKLPNEDEAIITDTKKVINTLNSLCIEMDERYDLLKEAQVRNIKEYNAKFIARRLNPNKGHKFLPYIVLVVDEFADLIMTAGKEVEMPIARLAQLARAIGIHLIIATQRPSVNIITGTIKANFPARIAFRVTSKIDSRTILDSGGADQLIGRGDLLLSTGADLTRIQCAFVDTPEVEKITDFIGTQRGYPEAFMLPEYVGESEDGPAMKDFNMGDRDAFFDEAARIIVQHQQGSASLLQRRLKLGYNRAGRIIDQLEAAGIIGPFEGSKAREVLYTDLNSLEQYLSSLK